MKTLRTTSRGAILHGSKHLFGLLAMIIAALAVAACSSDSFKIKGRVEGLADGRMTVERPDLNGDWVTMDTVRTDAKGRFSVSLPSPASPEIYRLNNGGNFIYFPIEAHETLQLEARNDRFATDYTLSGSPMAEQMAAFDKEVNALPSDPETIGKFKRRVYAEIIQQGRGNILSYYVLTKMHGDHLLFDPTDPDDVKYYGAVATQFSQFNPDDPHAKMLERQALMAIQAHRKSEPRTIQAQEVAMFEISLPDTEGATRNLSDLLGKGRPVVVIFSLHNAEGSPEVNRRLAEAYQAVKGSADFFQVSFDDDQYSWREAARNIPWLNVYDAKGAQSRLLGQYNVTAFPAIIIYNRAGEIAARASTPEEIPSLLRSL